MQWQKKADWRQCLLDEKQLRFFNEYGYVSGVKLLEEWEVDLLMLVHGSYENRSDRPRRAFVTNVFADGTLSDSDAALMHGTPPIGKGEKITGRFFPLLFDVKEGER